MSNICEIPSVKDLTFFLQSEGAGSHIVLAVTLEETDKNDKTLIKKFLKSKHTNYPNVKFAYFCAKNQDLGKLKTLLGKDKNTYPYLFYIYDINTICALVNNAVLETMEQSFDMMKKYYVGEKKISTSNVADSGDQHSKRNESSIKNKKYTDDDEEDNGVNLDIDDISDDDNILDSSTKHQNNNKINPLLEMKDKLELNQKKFMLEQKKTLEKIILLKRKTSEFNATILKDLKERKQIETEEKIAEIAENKQSKKNDKINYDTIKRHGRKMRVV